ncbi:hypothetical protein MMC10_007686 [Thelotrema lepadinum]|nr:hypothetical protein [Thelotrema lepadinum]
MPLSHLSLTVSHLPTSCSFYLATLQPLGYRYIGQHHNYIGFGIDEADFFISQEPQGLTPGATHVAFDARSRKAVDAFFTAALKAGGCIHDRPAVRDSKTGYYSAAVIDFDGNAVEAVHRHCAQDRMSLESSAREIEAVYQPPSDTPRSVANESKHRSPLQNVVNNIVTTKTTTLSAAKDNVDTTSSSKALMGTLLGAAAGAVVAYAMVKAEQPDPPKNPEVKHSKTIYQTVEAPPTPRSAVSATSRRSRRHSISYSDISSPRSTRPVPIRMIEGPPTPPSQVSSPSTIRPKHVRTIEVPPALSPVDIRRATRAPSEAFSHDIPLPPSAEAYYTVDVEHAPSHTSQSSRNTMYSTRSRRHSTSHHSRSPPPSSPTAITSVRKTPADFPLPASAFSAPFIQPPPKPRSSRASHAAAIPLPPSTTSTRFSKPHSSRVPEAYPLPPSTTRSSHPSSRSHPRRVEPASHPLPPSARTSFVSRPPSHPRSVASHASRSTVKPLTRANLGSRAGGGGRAMTDIDDSGSLAPSDSISQVSGKERRRRRKRRESEGGGR